MSKDRFTEVEKTAIVNAIRTAEQLTSGEVRVHIDELCEGDALDRAVAIFHKLGMSKTAERNAVLIYLALDDKKFAIIGDKGINAVIPPHFWDDERDLMISYFKKDQFIEGLVEGILKVGEQLRAFFPHQSDDKNELDNDITFGQE
ncbi:MAG: TPM domain-containing protein [Bacteroidota bacterium]